MYNLASHPEVLDRILQTLAGAFDVIVSGMTVVEVLDDIWTFAVSRNLPALGTAGPGQAVQMQQYMWMWQDMAAPEPCADVKQLEISPRFPAP
jgi:hypothetical protein